jgi:hypothetical protein
MHISDLRDIDFKDKGASELTEDDVKVIGTRYNRGPNLGIDKIKNNMSYGEFIVSRKSILEELIK